MATIPKTGRITKSVITKSSSVISEAVSFGLSGKTFLVSDYPEFQLQAKLVEQYEQMLKQYKQLNTEGNLVIGGTVSRDYPGASGSGAYIALTVTEPFGTIGKKDQNKVIAENQLISAKMQKDYVEMTLEGKVREAILTAKFAAMVLACI